MLVDNDRPCNFINLTGSRFGRLEVLELCGNRSCDGRLLWKCKCDCGKEVLVVGQQMRRGQTQSCGCLMIERTKEANTRHGMKGTRVYRIWAGMLNRCRNQNSKDFRRYGGRGIEVCDRWHSFENFYADMGEPPSDLHSIDRYPNGAGNYEPGNCRWATPQQQIENRNVAAGERNGNAKLDRRGVRRVLELRASGRTFASIAGSMGISKRQVGRIVHKQSWNNREV